MLLLVPDLVPDLVTDFVRKWQKTKTVGFIVYFEKRVFELFFLKWQQRAQKS